jgi:hypothetical protein
MATEVATLRSRAEYELNFFGLFIGIKTICFHYKKSIKKAPFFSLFPLPLATSKK